MEEKFDLIYFNKGLGLLSSKMEKENIEPFSLHVIGGFCMLVYGHRGLTRDIDAYFNMDSKLEKLIYEVGKEIHNYEWLNNNVKTSSKSMTDMPTLSELLNVDNSFNEYKNYGFIKIYLATDLTLLYTKLLAFRDDESHSDIEDISSLLNSSNMPISEIIIKLKKYNRSNDDFQNMVFNLLLVAFKCGKINEKEYEIEYIKYM